MSTITAENSTLAPGGGQESNRARLRALVIGPLLKQNLTTGKPKELPADEDLLDRLASDGKIVEPPFDKLVLAMLPEHSTELGQVVTAMAQNIDGFGHRLESRLITDDQEQQTELGAVARAEQVQILNFLENCCEDYSFTELRKRTRWDIETTGEAYWEVIRVPSTNEIVGLNHIPSHQVRIGVQDSDFTEYQRMTPVLQLDGSVNLMLTKRFKRWRKYIQARVRGIGREFVQIRGYRHKWFKEFGDTRVMHNETGDITEEQIPEDQRAGELLHWKIYSPRTPYGLPRYIGNLVTLFGDRAADEINYTTLKNNNIPSMAILISGGQLTEGSITRIQEFIENQIQNTDNYSRFLLLEAEGQFEGTDVGHMKIDIKPLTSEQMRDQLFQEYSKNNREKVREAFRLPPIFVGHTTDYTRATAESSRRLADEQIFKPERDEFDKIINKLLFPAMGFRFHKFQSNGPNVTDDEDLIKVMQGGEKTGAITPRIARMLLADILGRADLPKLDSSVHLDIPFSLQLAEALKNTADMDAQLAVKNASGGDLIKQLLDFRDGLEQELVKRESE